ncbi:MAG TPA: L,D-transpeptidase/peptidoglycan binding protein [Actinomycetota bacterium]|nr:L,D-transpeptidase/peptidoglycan binding protein [Actinomycetota bacterium]
MSRGRHARRTLGGGLPLVLIALASLVVLGAGTGFAAYRYERARADRILPGVDIEGIDVSGMTRAQAVRAVASLVDRTLDRELVVTAADRSWVVTPRELGMRADVEGAVDRALAVADELSLPSRFWHRFREIPVGRSVAVGYSYDEAAVRAFIQEVYRAVAEPARDAAIRLEEGRVLLQRSRIGQALKEQLALARIRRALEEGRSRVSLPVRDVEPEVTEANLGYTIVVDRSRNELYLYRGLKLVKTYPVATARPPYVTPPGEWVVVDKRENPTWYNPAPEGWGADLPLVIPPGPGNPLGTHALYLNAPGIRIHGTYDTDSIGTYASHGCIRMYLQDAEELFDTVPVGTRVLII